jgi:hypothetical protein
MKLRAFSALTPARTPSPRPSPRWGEGDHGWAARGSARGAEAHCVPFSPRGEGARRADEGVYRPGLRELKGPRVHSSRAL